MIRVSGQYSPHILAQDPSVGTIFSSYTLMYRSTRLECRDNILLLLSFHIVHDPSVGTIFSSYTRTRSECRDNILLIYSHVPQYKIGVSGQYSPLTLFSYST